MTASLARHAIETRYEALPLESVSESQFRQIASLSAESPVAHPLQTVEFVVSASAADRSPFALLATDESGLVDFWLGFLEQYRRWPIRLHKAMLRSGPVLRSDVTGSAANALIQGLVRELLPYNVAGGATKVVVTSETVHGADLHQALSTAGFDRKELATYLIDLQPPLEEIWSAVEPKARRSVKVSERRGVSVGLTESPEDIRDFGTMLGKILESGGMPIPLPGDYNERCLRLIRASTGWVIAAKDAGRIVGGKLVVAAGDMAVSYHTSAVKGSLRSGDLLAWSEIALAKEMAFKTLDLLSVELEAEPGSRQEGILKFKAKWGGSLIMTPVFSRELPLAGWRKVLRTLSRTYH